jgi:hypothetical protein
MHFEQLGPDKFEELVVSICIRWFGQGVQGFAKGKDGGKDAKFVGMAECFPSKSSPWTGVTIVQAKHTIGNNASFSDPTFFKEDVASCPLRQELDKVKKLYQDKQMDNYILFSNRKLTGIADDKIKKFINRTIGMPESNVYLVGSDKMSLALRQYPEILRDTEFHPEDFGLSVSPDEISELIEHISSAFEVVNIGLDDFPEPRLNLEEKNIINNMSAEFCNKMVKSYLKYYGSFDDFLSSPANTAASDLYNSIVEEFNMKIIAKARRHDNFDELIVHIIDILLERDRFLKSKKNLTTAMVFYMYWNCDLGRKVP